MFHQIYRPAALLNNTVLIKCLEVPTFIMLDILYGNKKKVVGAQILVMLFVQWLKRRRPGLFSEHLQYYLLIYSLLCKKAPIFIFFL